MLALTSAQWDITDAAAAERIVEPGDMVVNCAAYTAVDAAEADPDARARRQRGRAPAIIAQACATAGARLIHISTDYVFSGAFDGVPRPYDVDDPTGPLSVYGKTKLAGEQAVHAALPDAHVVRTAWVYTGGGTATSSAAMRGWRRRRARRRGGRPDRVARPTSATWSRALLGDRRPADGAAAAARRQRGRGQQVRAGARGVRRRRRRS